MAEPLKKLRSYSQQSELIYDIHNHSISTPTREIYLHGWEETIEDEEIGMEYRMASRFEKNINLLNSMANSNILIHQHSIGGEWNDGISIFNNAENRKIFKIWSVLLHKYHRKRWESI